MNILSSLENKKITDYELRKLELSELIGVKEVKHKIKPNKDFYMHFCMFRKNK